MPHHIIILFSVATGAVMALIMRATTDIPFIQSLVITIISGTLTGAALIFSAYLTGRRTDERVSSLDERLDDVKGQLGAAKRRTDKIDAERNNGPDH